MRLLVIRLSALGDVALTVPVLHELIRQNPNIEVAVLSRPFMEPLFQPLAIKFYGADVYGKHKGITGLKKLHSQILQDFKPDVVVDLHGVMRAWVLGTYFKLSGKKVFSIDKGRKEKKALTRPSNKVLKPLKHTTQRYAEVFEKAGFVFDFLPEQVTPLAYNNEEAKEFWENQGHPSEAIAVAPFAYHQGKMWPIQKMERLLGQLSQQGYTILFFGGKEDLAALNELTQKTPNSLNLATRFNLAGELYLISKVKLMIAMDSSNMHLATLVGTPVVSIWGATHHYAGFGPLGNNTNTIVEVELNKLDCRPCSVFGNKPCAREDYACIQWLGEEMVMKKVDLALQMESKE